MTTRQVGEDFVASLRQPSLAPEKLQGKCSTFSPWCLPQIAWVLKQKPKLLTDAKMLTQVTKQSGEVVGAGDGRWSVVSAWLSAWALMMFLFQSVCLSLLVFSCPDRSSADDGRRTQAALG